MPGSIGHLMARFFESLTARPLSISEVDQVNDLLGPALSDVFFEQPPIDQRHGLDAAHVAMADGDSAPDLVMAALLHDIGKRHARLGISGRSLASTMIRLRLPLPDRFRAYRDHGPAGAAELARLGAPVAAVEFARHHHGSRPERFDESAWALLEKADLPQTPGTRSRGS